MLEWVIQALSEQRLTCAYFSKMVELCSSLLENNILNERVIFLKNDVFYAMIKRQISADILITKMNYALCYIYFHDVLLTKSRWLRLFSPP